MVYIYLNQVKIRLPRMIMIKELLNFMLSIILLKNGKQSSLHYLFCHSGCSKKRDEECPEPDRQGCWNSDGKGGRRGSRGIYGVKPDNEEWSEIIVNQPYFAPYRYVKMEILSSINDIFEYVFVWYDCNEDSVEEILFHIRDGLEIASKYE